MVIRHTVAGIEAKYCIIGTQSLAVGKHLSPQRCAFIPIDIAEWPANYSKKQKGQIARLAPVYLDKLETVLSIDTLNGAETEFHPMAL